MDLTNIENLAEDYNGVMCLLVCQNVFAETVDAEEMITKDFKQAVPGFLGMISLSNRLSKLLVDKGTEIAVVFRNLSFAEELQIFSTMSEPETAFSDHTIGSMKKLLYHNMEDYGYIYIHKLV